MRGMPPCCRVRPGCYSAGNLSVVGAIVNTESDALVCANSILTVCTALSVANSGGEGKKCLVGSGGVPAIPQAKDSSIGDSW